MRKWTWILIGAALVIIGLAVATKLLLTRRPVDVVIVVPDGFRGMAVIKFGRAAGETVAAVDGQSVFRIPDSGELAVRNSNPQYGPRTETVRYRNGQIIPEAYLTQPETLPRAETVAAWPLLLEGDDAGFFIGTLKERQELRRKTEEKVRIRNDVRDANP